MKKHFLMSINMIISLIIITGFLSTFFINFLSYGDIIKDDIKNISKLTSTNIYSEINNELIKPIYVSLTMANDSFLKNWLEEETAEPDELHITQLQDYLLGIKMKYNYDSVFLISEQSKYYYYYSGINKMISMDDAHDDWYYSFIDKNISYDLDVDQDEVANNALTIFINCRIIDTRGALMGVVGVGIKMDEIQQLLQSFETNFQLDAFLIAPDGIIQAHSDSEKIESVNYFEELYVSSLKDSILRNKTALETFRFERDHQDGYLITRYIEEFDWYLIVEKDNSVLNTIFQRQIVNDLIVIGFVLMLLLILSSVLISRYNSRISHISRTDVLTGLPNRRSYNEQLGAALKQYQKNGQAFCLFVFDLDGFKSVNDNFGHLAGDKVITEAGKIAASFLGHSVILARWGGDEFSGIIFDGLDQAEKKCSELVHYIGGHGNVGGHSITLSVGLTEVKPDDTCDSVITRADLGLYEAKKAGKNRVFCVTDQQ